MIRFKSRNKRKKIQLALFGILFVLFASYVYFGFARYLRGPTIEVDDPLASEIVFTESYVEITGKAHNVSFMWLNDRQIFTDSRGNFREGQLLLPGYNIITLRARDSFGRAVEKKFEVSLLETPPSLESYRSKAENNIETSTSSDDTTS